ncbi:hypothetical protein BZZ01_23220 [Nostocales cyanobacterium HT-58-2]|nr:hypothetical protein BZZ01_23220 [Nostocales cyanobacterium HT-58-2]
MNKEKRLKVTARLRPKYAQCIYLALETTIIITSVQTTVAIFMKPTLAVDSTLNISPLHKANSTFTADDVLDISPLQKLLTPANLSEIPVGVVSTSNLNQKEDKELSKPKILPTKQLSPTQQIAQTDSSGVVGDTLGEINKLRQQLLIDPIFIEGRPLGQAAPASSAGTPTAYGASWRQAYVGVGGYLPFDGNSIDGSASVGFGLGDAVESIGAEINVSITSLGGQNFDFGESGGIGIKLHKYFADGTAVAVGWSNPVKWGEVNNAKDTFYGVVTKSFYLQPNNQLPLTVSLGVGTGSFRSKGALEADENSVNFFGGLGLRVAPQVSVVSSWTGNSLNVGGSFTPLRQIPIVINAIFTDVTNNLDKGTGLSLSAGYVFRF